MDLLKDYRCDEIKQAKKKKRAVETKKEARKALIKAEYERQLGLLDAEFQEEFENTTETLDGLLRDKREKTKAFFLSMVPENVGITRMIIEEEGFDLWFLEEDWLLQFKLKKYTPSKDKTRFDMSGHIYLFKQNIRAWTPDRIYYGLTESIEKLILNQKEYRLRSVFDEDMFKIHDARLKEVYLTALEKKVIMLHKQGSSYEEIGQQLGKTKKAIDNTMNRYYHKLFY